MHAFYGVFVVAKWIDINNIHRLIESRLVNPGACRRPQRLLALCLGTLRLKNGLKSNLQVSQFYKFPRKEISQIPLLPFLCT